MAMDFFHHQEQARKRTGLLLFYFVLAVLLTIVAVNAAVWLVSSLSFVTPGATFGGWLASGQWLPISLVTLAVIAGGSLRRYLELGDGSHRIAEAVHATRIDPDTDDPQQRMLLNIVEEMAIASGTPVPTVYVMRNEPGINAFVAGLEPTAAVLVVTRGALETFDRDEMQGVIGHEFSHILNGDMRMNVHLYAILAGILMIGRIGEFLLRGRGRRSGGSSKGAGAIMLLGVALMAIGYIGLFFGRLIKAAISRQRELLADASSVQFTRNPQGLGEALLKIRNANGGSLLADARAEDMSHMCFALPVQMGFAGLLATHPPLDLRIATIDAALLARDRARARVRAGAAPETPAAPAGTSGLVAGGSAIASAGTAGNLAPLPFIAAPPAAAGTPPLAMAPALAASVGQPTPANLALAVRLHDSIPPNVRDLLRTPAGARVVTYGIMISGTDTAHEEAALQQVATGDSEKTAARVRANLPEFRRLGTRLHLPCHDLALVALRELSSSEKVAFLDVLNRLARIDNRLTVREYVLLSLMRKYLTPATSASRPVRHRSYTSVGGELNSVISLLCHAAGGAEASRVDLHARLMRGFGVGSPALLPATSLGAGVLHDALTALAGLSPLLKKPLLDACIDCISHDGRLQVAEVELVRAIGEALDCPIPPLPGYA